MRESQTGFDQSPRLAIPRTLLHQAVLLFGSTSLIFFGLLYLALPFLRQHNTSWFICFNLTLAAPMFLLVGFALFGFRTEGNRFHWGTLRDRFRLGRMSLSTWTWAIALAVFMYGGSYASFAAFCLVALALFFDQEKSFREKGMTAAAVASFLACSWLVWQSRPVLATPPLHALPATLQDFLAHLTDPHAFMGIPLHGQWWIAVYYAVVLIFGNIAGEELWWRGFILPRQEAANGSVAWLLHGVLWAAFHLFFQATAWDMVRMMPTCCALAFVAQSRRNTWPGIIAHTAANSAIPIGIIRGIIS